MHRVLSVIVPASNEERLIGACLSSVFASQGATGEVIVVANGCHDRTAGVARDMAATAAAAGWALTVIDLAQGSKPAALNAGDAAATWPNRVYLDADVTLSPGILSAMKAALETGMARYVGGTPRIPRAESAVTRAYARFWQRLPFNRSIAPGYGLFAVNAAGRARWGEFPDLISDDTFVRLQFAPEERVQVADFYDWPMIEGFAALTRVRRRQNAGVAQLHKAFPGLLAREGKPPLGLATLVRLALRDPAGFFSYSAVTLAVKLRRGGPGFTRGR